MSLVCNGASLAWVNVSTGDVYRANLDGTGVSVIAPAVAMSATDVEIDDASVMVAVGGFDGRIIRVPLDGSAPSLAAAPEVHTIALHDGATYWADSSAIRRGSDVVHTTQGLPIDVAVDATGIYYATDRAIWAAPIDGGAARKLTDTSRPKADTLRLDADRVVWGTSGALLRVTKGIGFAETIATTSVNRVSISADVYAWSDKDAVYVMRDGEEPRTLAPALGGGGIALCGGFMFWLSRDAGVIMRAVP